MTVQHDDRPDQKSPRDFRPWEEFDFLPSGCFLYQQAAREIADAEGWTDAQLEELQSEMVAAINSKVLPTVSRKTGLRVEGGPPEFLGVVIPADVNVWLEGRGASYRWSPPEPPGPAASPAPAVTAVAAPAGPEPLSTGDIAFCFDGLVWSEKEWKKPLGDLPQWLKHCLVTHGTQGGHSRRWNPVLIGLALVHRKDVAPNRVRAKFQTKPQLKPWLEVWKTNEADNFDEA